MHASARNATVVCQTDVSVLSIGRDDFVNIFMHAEGDEEPEFISFLRTVELFDKWPVESLPYNNPNICLLTFFRRGVVMCKDNAENEWIYCVKVGSCRLVKKLKLKDEKTSALSKYSRYSRETEKSLESKKQFESFIEVKKLVPKDIFVSLILNI